MKLHLGVIDIPYAKVPAEYKAFRSKSGTPGSETTGDVAEWLENKYHVMEVFFESKHEAIAKSIEVSVHGAIENMMLGSPHIGSPLEQAASSITTEFKQFLSSREIEAIGIPGVPTQAALDGVSHRFKNPRGKYVGKGKNKKFRKNPRRPSFIDTGLYQASMTSWFSE